MEPGAGTVQSMSPSSAIESLGLVGGLTVILGLVVEHQPHGSGVRLA